MTDEIPLLTFSPDADGVRVDLDQLVTSRMLIQANSGGGKSWMLRYVLEQTHARIQHIIIDPEGEFASLRERFPYVLVGQRGDFPTDPASAPALCQRLVELEVSAILDLSDLRLDAKRHFVRRFLDTLMHLPEALWHPLMLVIDEAHKFAPEGSRVESTDAVIHLADAGRKRAFMAVIATQRLSKLHKDVAAELNNVVIGRTGLDVDVVRAGNILGFDKERRQTLRYLPPGTFYAFGPAISREVVQVRSGLVATTHPEPGRVAPPTPPPPEQIRALLAQLTNLPAQEEPAPDQETAQQRIAALEQQLRERPRLDRAVERIAVPTIEEQQLTRLEAVVRELTAALGRVARPVAPATTDQRPPPRTTSRRPTKRPAKQAAKPRARKPVAKRAAKPPVTPPDAMARTLAIPAIASKIAQARATLDDASAAGYIPRILRMLWAAALRPEELAEGRGTASVRTLGRLRSACRALQQARLLADAGDGRLRVNHEEIERLRTLASALGKG